MTHQAEGSFEVRVQPLPSPPAEGLLRMGIEKEFSGPLEGSSRGEMISGGDPKQGAAGYVAMEMVSGKLHGKAGGFALQHAGTMDSAGQTLRVTVVPGSGSGELRGIAGQMTITIAAGRHAYAFEYTLPGK